MDKRGVVCGILFAAVLAAAVGATEFSTIPAAVAVSSAVALAETEIMGLVRTMTVLAETTEVRTGVWSEMAGLLATFERNSLPLTAWFLLPDGAYYTVTVGLASGNLSGRTYFPRLMAGEVVVGDVVVSKSTGRKSTVVAVPVVVDGAVIGALGVSLFLDGLSAKLSRDLALPQGWAFYAIDALGEIALSSDPSLLMESAAAVGGLQGNSAQQASPLLGWSFGVGPAE